MPAAAITVWNAGVPGDTTAELLLRFDRDVASRRPDAVIVEAGVNDFFFPGHQLPEATFRRNLRRVLERIAALPAQPVLMSLPPFYAPWLVEQYPATLDDERTIPERVDAGNAAIREIAAERNCPVIEADCLLIPADESANSLIQNEVNSGRRDGMHPTAAGAKVLAAAAAQTLQTLPGPVRRIVCLGNSVTYGVYLTGKGRAEGETYPGQLAMLLHGKGGR